MKLLTIALVFFFSAFNYAQAKEAVSSNGVELTKKQIEAVKKAVRKELKDPDAAKFGSIKGALKDGTIYVCGMVNGKNSYGAYAGEKPFIGLLATGDDNQPNSHFAVMPMAGNTIPDDIVLSQCYQHGIILH